MPAYDVADLIGETLSALLADERLDRIVVVDDGSSDRTADLAAEAGVEVIRHERNRGKGAALITGAQACADADIVLFVDADLSTTAGAVVDLVELVGPRSLVVGVPVEAAGRGGFGLVRDLAATGIERAIGRSPRSALSGQRAMPRQLVDDVTIAPRFAVEVAMTIDAVRLGYDLVEVDIDVDHRHRGRSVSGFAHRAGQGVDVVRALVPRLGWTATASVVGEVLLRRIRNRG